MDNMIRCSVCGKLISSKYQWNPEIKNDNEATFHQFNNSDVAMCEKCYKQYRKLFEKKDNNE